MGSTVNKWNTKCFPDIVTAISSTNFLVSQSVSVQKHDSNGNILSKSKQQNAGDNRATKSFTKNYYSDQIKD